MGGYEASPVLLEKRVVSPYSNNFIGELVGMEISTEFIARVNHLENRNICVLTDCQRAFVSNLVTIFHLIRLHQLNNIL